MTRSALIILLLFGVFIAKAQTAGDYRSFGVGTDWNTAANWELCAVNGIWPGVASVTYPGQNAAVAGSTVTIRNGHTRTIDAATPQPIVNLIIGEGASGVVSIGANANASGYSLTCSGTVTISTGGTLQGAGNDAGNTHTFTFQSTLTNNGTISFTAATDQVALDVTGTTINNASISFSSNTGVKTFRGAVSNTGTWNTTGITTSSNLIFRSGVSSTANTFQAGAATFNDAASNAQTIGGTAAMSFANTVTLSDAGGASLVVTNTNTNIVTLSNTGAGTLTGTAGVTWQQGAGSTFNYAGSTITNITLDASTNTNTVNYTAAGGQTVSPVVYNTLTLSGSGSKTMANVSTNGNFNLSGSATATPTVSLTIGGNITLGTGTTFNEGSLTHNIAGDWINNGCTLTNAGTINLNGAAQNVGGSSTTTFNGVMMNGSGTKTLGMATTINGNLYVASGVVVNPGGITTHTANTLTLGNVNQSAGTWGSTSSAATNQNNTFFTAGTAGLITVTTVAPAQTYYSRQTGNWSSPTTWSTVTYGNATNTGTIPVVGDIVNIGGGDFTIAVDVNSACASMNYQGGVTNSPSVSINNGITLNVSGLISLASASFFDTNTLAVGGGILNAGSIDFADGGGFGGGNSLTISTGTATVINDVTGELGLTLGVAQTTINITSTGTLDLNGTFLNSTNAALTAAAGSTVNYSGPAQAVGDFTYANLTFSGTDTKTPVGIIDVTGNLTIGAGTTFVSGAFDHTIGGNWINNGSFTHSGRTITFDGAAQNIGGTNTTSFNNIALNGSGIKTFGAASFSAGYFAVGSGVVVNLGGFTTHTANSLTLGGVGQVAGVWGGTGSGAANINATYFGATLGRITTGTMGSSFYYSIATGDWDANATWSNIGFGGAAATSFPTAGSIVNIGGGNFTVTVDANAACASLSYQGNAGNSPSVNLNSGITLNVSGAIDIPATTFFDVNTLAVGAGILNASSIDFSDGGFFGGHELSISTGTVTVSGSITATSTTSFPQFTFSGAGIVNVAGDFLNSGAPIFTASTGTVNYNGTAQTISNLTYNNLTTSGSSTKTFIANTDINGNVTIGSGTTLVGGGYTHTVGGNWINNGSFTNTGNTISLDGTAQSIGGANATTFNNLTLAGSGTKTFTIATTINTTIAINSGVVADLGAAPFVHQARTLSLNNQGQIPGTWGSTSSSATNTNDTYFANTGILNVTNRIYFANANNGNWDNSGSWSTVTYGGGTNAGTFPQAGDIASIGGNFNIIVNVNSACAFITFQGATGNTNTLTMNSGIQLDVSNSITIPRANNGDSNTLAVGAGILNAGSLLFTSGGGASTRHRLTISTGTVTISGDVTESGSTGSATITFTGAGQLLLGGAFLNSSNGTLTASTGTVTYNGTVAQTIGDFTYYNLTLNNSSGSIPQLTLTANTTVTNTLTMTSGIVNLNGFVFTLGASGAASTFTRTVSSTTNWVYGGEFLRFWPSATAITSTSLNYYGLFPMGIASASSYRPVEINSTSNPTGTGSVSVTHTGSTTVTDLSPVFDDGGVNIVRKHNARFVMTTTATGGVYNLGVTMTGLPSIGNLSDIRLAVSNGSTTVTTVGTHASATGSLSNPTANRTGIALADLVGDFRITTSDLATPLPITLISFTGEETNGEVVLNWKTESEINNDYFTVLRSSDGNTFKPVGTLDGNGTTNAAHVYSLTDNNPTNGKNYYQLTQTDFDGTSTASEIIMVSVTNAKTMAVVYPNPVRQNQSLNVSIDGLRADTELEVQVLNLQGLKVNGVFAKTDSEGNLRISFSGVTLPSGLYMIKAANANLKFVVE
ncbi:MAG: hypothetical protein JST48_04405 [Bacteroidetes bacterium]|nr:hypothetical protein [Bacteroidota bacterium]